MPQTAAGRTPPEKVSKDWDIRTDNPCSRREGRTDRDGLIFPRPFRCEFLLWKRIKRCRKNGGQYSGTRTRHSPESRCACRNCRPPEVKLSFETEKEGCTYRMSYEPAGRTSPENIKTNWFIRTDMPCLQWEDRTDRDGVVFPRPLREKLLPWKNNERCRKNGEPPPGCCALRK